MTEDNIRPTYLCVYTRFLKNFMKSEYRIFI